MNASTEKQSDLFCKVADYKPEWDIVGAVRHGSKWRVIVRVSRASCMAVAETFMHALGLPVEHLMQAGQAAKQKNVLPFGHIQPTVINPRIYWEFKIADAIAGGIDTTIERTIERAAEDGVVVA